MDQIDKILHGDREEEMKHGKMRENALKQHSHLQMQTLVLACPLTPAPWWNGRLNEKKIIGTEYISSDPREKKRAVLKKTNV